MGAETFARKLDSGYIESGTWQLGIAIYLVDKRSNNNDDDRKAKYEGWIHQLRGDRSPE